MCDLYVLIVSPQLKTIREDSNNIEDEDEQYCTL